MMTYTLILSLSAITTNAVFTNLDAVQEKAVRDAVYNKNPQVYSPKMDFHSVLAVPEQLTKLYQKHPKAVIEVLQKVVDGGSPKDSATAAGYAIELMKGPGVGVVVLDHYKKDTYDSIDPTWKVTPRTHWAGRVRSHMKEAFEKK